MGISLDLGGIARPKWEPLPEGEYTLLLSDLTVADGKKDKAKLVASCTYEVVEPAEFAGRKILHWQTLNGDEDAMKFTKVWLEALVGEPCDGEISLDEDDLIGKHCAAYIVQKPDNRDSTKMQNNISYFKLPFDVE